MARALRALLFFAVTLASLSALLVLVPPSVSPAHAADLDKKGKADAREAMRLYKEGQYEDAAKVFAKLSVAYPDMLVFVRNLGACYYYLRRWEPALSNLRDYEHRKKDLAPDDQAELAGWIGEMERLRDMAMVPVTAPAPGTPAVAASVAAETVSPPAAPPAAPAPTPVPAVPSPPAESTAAAPPSPPAAAQSTYPSEPYPARPTYPPGGYGEPASPYGAAGYPGAGYPPPASYSQGYPSASDASGAPAGQVAAAPPPSHSGRRVAAWGLGLTGATAIVIGVACTAKALDDFSKVQKQYDPSLEDEGKKLAVAQWVGYGVGGALLATAFVVGSVGSSAGNPSRGIALAPAVGPGSAGATLMGKF